MTWVFGVVALAALLPLVALMLDAARVGVARAELQDVADSAARAAMQALKRSGGTWQSATDAAVAVASLNRSDGHSVVLDRGDDLEFGTWNHGTFTRFSGTSDFNTATAIRVVARRVASRGNGVPALLPLLTGKQSIDVTATSTVAGRGGVVIAAGSAEVRGTSSLWYAGQSGFQQHSFGGETWNSTIAAATPVTIPVVPGQRLRLRASGSMNNVNAASSNTPDGDAWITNVSTHTGGMSNISAPINSLVGVFLSNDDPRNSPAPVALDFSSPAARNYDLLEPLLKQSFFIGDGLDDVGDQQEVVVPPGATRLFLGNMDPFGWQNNWGRCSVSVTAVAHGIMVVD